MADKIKVLLVEPLRTPRVMEVDHTLRNLQKLVGGFIQTFYPYHDPVVMVCDDEGKLNGKEPNRALLDDDGRPYDIVCGTFFLCGIGDDDFASIPDEMAEKYAEVYKCPEVFFHKDGNLYWGKLADKPTRIG